MVLASDPTFELAFHCGFSLRICAREKDLGAAERKRKEAAGWAILRAANSKGCAEFLCGGALQMRVQQRRNDIQKLCLHTLHQVQGCDGR